jgi:hypothetical protein
MIGKGITVVDLGFKGGIIMQEWLRGHTKSLAIPLRAAFFS